MVPERFPRVHVAQVHLDERDLHGEQRIAQRDARVGEAGGVEDDEGHVAGRRLVDPRDQLGLGIALERRQVVPGLGGELRHPLVDLVEGDLAVDAGFTGAEQVQVRAVQQQDVCHEGSGSPGEGRQV